MTWKRLNRRSKALIAVAILGIVVLFISAVPILSCPACNEWLETYMDDLHCNFCNNRRTVTTLEHWQWQWRSSH